MKFKIVNKFSDKLVLYRKKGKMILQCNHLFKHFKTVNKTLTVLNDINFSIKEGEVVSIIGPSGSGKTTLMGLCAGLDDMSEGEVILSGNNLNSLSQDEKALLRNQKVGFIFQNFQLLPTLTALENVMLPLEFLGESKLAKTSAKKLIDRVGLTDRMHHYPSQLSGGEQQRIAIARAFSNSPKILFADEPTGNLDGETSAMVESLLFDLNKEKNTTLIIVTHDLELANKTDRIIQLKGGRVFSDTIVNNAKEA